MELFWKSVGCLLIAAVLGLILGRDISLLLSLTVCTMGAAVAIYYLEPVLSLLKQMEQMANLRTDTMKVLVKILGIGMLSEIASMVCSDAGSSAMSKLLRILTCVAILWISIPVVESLLSILQVILGEV